MRNQHTTAVHGAGEPTLNDVLKIGKSHSISHALAVVDEVRDAVSKWPAIAQKWEVSEPSSTRIAHALAKVTKSFRI